MGSDALLLGVKRGKFRMDDPNSDHANSEFKKQRPAVLKSSSFTCQHCGFQSKKYQEVHHIDDNHTNNDLSNLSCVCPLCHSCHHIGLSGQLSKGCLIYLDPSLQVTQAQLNSLVRLLWIREETGNQAQKNNAISFLSRIYKQTIPARRLLGASETDVLANYLLSLSDIEYEARGERLKGIYFLPFKDGFAKQLSHWIEESALIRPVDSWSENAETKSKKWFDYDGNLPAFATQLGITT